MFGNELDLILGITIIGQIHQRRQCTCITINEQTKIPLNCFTAACFVYKADLLEELNG